MNNIIFFGEVLELYLRDTRGEFQGVREFETGSDFAAEPLAGDHEGVT